jgi:hypothetical protein
MGSDDDSTAEASEASAEDGSRFEMETIQMAEGSPEEMDDGITRWWNPKTKTRLRSTGLSEIGESLPVRSRPSRTR